MCDKKRTKTHSPIESGSSVGKLNLAIAFLRTDDLTCTKRYDVTSRKISHRRCLVIIFSLSTTQKAVIINIDKRSWSSLFVRTTRLLSSERTGRVFRAIPKSFVSGHRYSSDERKKRIHYETDVICDRLKFSRRVTTKGVDHEPASVTGVARERKLWEERLRSLRTRGLFRDRVSPISRRARTNL